jgi:hypothetical protein
VSLTDGYAFDAKDKTYCKGPPELLAHQKKTTYMKDYAKLIDIAKKVICPVMFPSHSLVPCR